MWHVTHARHGPSFIPHDWILEATPTLIRMSSICGLLRHVLRKGIEWMNWCFPQSWICWHTTNYNLLIHVTTLGQFSLRYQTFLATIGSEVQWYSHACMPTCMPICTTHECVCEWVHAHWLIVRMYICVCMCECTQKKQAQFRIHFVLNYVVGGYGNELRTIFRMFYEARKLNNE